MKNILTIAKRELWSFINTPTAYIVTIAFIIPSYFLYWRQTLITNEASLRSFFSLMPWFLLLLVPALTMRALAEEQRKNTIELLLSHALKEWEIIIGKFLGILGFYTLILTVTLSLPATLMRWGNPDVGIIIGQYTGTLFMGAAMIAMGILISTWFKQAITAFLVTAGVLFGWLLLGLDLVTLALPWPANQIAYQLALLPHSEQLARGLIEIRDISFFVTITLVILSLASIKLSESKLTENKTKKSKLYAGAIVIAALGVVFHLTLTNWPQRIDLTRNNRFTLSEGTKTTLSNLPDIVTINLYASRNLPAPVQLIKQDIEDTLKDYARYGSGNIKISAQNPDTDPQIAQQAVDAGIQQIQFNTINSGKFTVESGFLGVVIRYGTDTEIIPYIQNSGNLEYDLTQKIRKLTLEDQPTIGILSDFGTQTQFGTLSAWNEVINSQYQTKTESINNPDSEITSNVVIIPGPRETAKESTASAKIKDYLNNQGKVMFLLDKIDANTQLGTANQIEHGWDKILNQYGLILNNDMAYDVQRNENIRIGQGFVQYIARYPYWVRTVPADNSPFEIPDGALMGWPSSITINNELENVNTQPLLMTSTAGGIIEGALNISPDTAPKQGQGTAITLAAAAEQNGSRIVLISDSEIAQNEFYQNSPANQVFLSNALDWLVADETLTQVPRRILVPDILEIQDTQQAMIMQYGNVIGIPVLIGIFGFWWLRRRNQLTQRTYYA